MNPTKNRVIMYTIIKIFTFSLTVFILMIGCLLVIDGNAYGLTVWKLFEYFFISWLLGVIIISFMYKWLVIPRLKQHIVIHYTMDEVGIAYEVEGVSGFMENIVSWLLTGSRNSIYIPHRLIGTIKVDTEKEMIILTQKNLMKTYLYLDQEHMEDGVLESLIKLSARC